MADLSQVTRDAVRGGAIQSAEALMPRVLSEARRQWRNHQTRHVLDVGTGEGHWLDAAADLLPDADLLGLDLRAGASWRHAVPVAPWDAELGEPLPSPSVLADENAHQPWDLVLCLEMAEHVSAAAGAHLVRELTRSAAMVVWSAAIPGQGGDGHVNEQWPRYWAEAFDSHGWHLADPWRWHVWACADVEPWYAQNLLLALPGRTDPGDWPHHLVHPTTWAHYRGVEA